MPLVVFVVFVVAMIVSATTANNPTNAMATGLSVVLASLMRALPPNDPSSAARPTRASDCNRDAMAGRCSAW